MTDLPYTLAERQAVQLGLLVLQADETIEPDMRRLLPPEVELLVSRVPSGTHVTSESLAKMESVLTEAARLLPSGARLSAVGYGCTSGTAQIGAERIRDLVAAGCATPAVTEPVSSLVAACGSLGARRIGLISPYLEVVSDRLRAVLRMSGIEVVAFASFNQSEERMVARIAPGAVLAAARTVAGRTPCDALFLSCTNLRTLDVIADAEDATGVPVLSSNQVLGWHLCRLAGLTTERRGFGMLWERTE